MSWWSMVLLFAVIMLFMQFDFLTWPNHVIPHSASLHYGRKFRVYSARRLESSGLLDEVKLRFGFLRGK